MSAVLRFCFFFHDPATTEIYTLSLHDALPISELQSHLNLVSRNGIRDSSVTGVQRSEEHTSELQSHLNLVCRLLLEIKKHTSELQSHLNHVYPLLLEKKKSTPILTTPPASTPL